MTYDDQLIRITTHDGKTHEAIGGAELIVARLRDREEIICGAGDGEYVLRVLTSDGLYVTYPESESDRTPCAIPVQRRQGAAVA